MVIYQAGSIVIAGDSLTLSMQMSGMRPPSEVVVRRYREGDEARIVPFLERVMGWPSVCSGVPRLDHWRWKFLGNPMGFHLVCVAEQDGEIVSHSASIPVQMSIGGTIVLASQGVDLCTDPLFRGRGLIGRTMECRNRMKDEHGIALDFGFPNQTAYHLSLIKQGFTDLGIRVMQHRYIIDEKRFFSKLRFGQLKRLGYNSYQLVRRSLGRGTEAIGGMLLESTMSFTPEVDGLGRLAAEEFDLMIVRDHRYMNWRYADPRAGDFIIRTARRNGRLVGWMVHKQEDREGSRFLNIVDALADPGSPEAISVLLMDAISLAEETGIETILCCLPDGHPYARSLADVGFLSQVRFTGERPMSMIYQERTLSETGMGGLPDGARVHIMLGDTDWV